MFPFCISPILLPVGLSLCPDFLLIIVPHQFLVMLKDGERNQETTKMWPGKMIVVFTIIILQSINWD